MWVIKIKRTQKTFSFFAKFVMYKKGKLVLNNTLDD